MQITIEASVGKLGSNRVDDVVKVQHLLAQQGMPVGRADGKCGPRTIAAITTFQAGFLHRPDGLVEPGGKTLKRLSMVGFRPAASGPVAAAVVSPQEIRKEQPIAGTKIFKRFDFFVFSVVFIAG